MKFIWIIMVSLAGCGGGDGGGPVLPPDDFDGWHDQITGLGITPLANVPVQGSYAYAGRIRLNLPVAGPARAFEGSFEVTLGFDSGGEPVFGTVSNLVADTTVLTGTLQIDAGAFNPLADPGQDYQFTADLGGALDDSGTIYVLDGTLAGDFYGTNAQGVAGVVFGDITQGPVVDIFDGAFVGDLSP